MWSDARNGAWRGPDRLAQDCGAQSMSKEYWKLLIYEFNNRDFAYLSIGAAAQKMPASPRAEFFKAYFELEVLTREIYIKYQDALGYDHRQSWITPMRAWAAELYVRFFNRKDASLATMVIIPYLPKLEKLRDLSDPAHKELFDYIIAQETAQLEAAQATKGGNWLAGAEVFRAFVREHEALRLSPIGDS